MAAFTLMLGAFVAVLLYQVIGTYRSLQRNIALAKSSGLPVVVSPFNLFSIFWLSTSKLWRPLIQTLLPQSMQGLWVE